VVERKAVHEQDRWVCFGHLQLAKVSDAGSD
jgi:hypothetical protein